MGALDLASLDANVANAAVQWGSDTINVRYKPSIATPGRLQTVMNSMESDDADISGFVGFISDLLEGWDILRAGTPIPTTPEGVSDVPIPVLRKIITTVMAEAQDVGEAPSSSVAG